MNTAILNARIIDPSSHFDEVSNLYIRNKKIAHIGAQAPDGFQANQEINAEACLLIPGLIDLSVYFRDPGQEFKATIESETDAAISAGITTLFYMPEPDTCVESMPMVNLIKKRIKAERKARVEIIGALTQGLKGEQLTNMGGLKYAKCAGVTNQRQAFNNSKTLRMALEYAATFDLPVFLHPIDHELVGNGCVHEGPIATRMGLPAIPVAAETTAVAQILALVEELGVSVHLCRLSAGNSVELVRSAKQKGISVTADVAAHQLFLTEMDISDFNPLCHVQPPLRSQRDLDALRLGVADGTIDAICSDHQPHEIDAKLAPFQQTEPGISALETLLPLTMRLVEEGSLPLDRAIAAVTCQAANITGNKQGTLQVGAQADFTLFNPDDLWRLERETMLSQGKNTPFAGWSFNGRTSKTFVRGKCVYER